MSRHNTQPLLAVAASNDEAVTALASALQSKRLSSSRSRSSSLPMNSSDDDDTPLEVNRKAEVAITPCMYVQEQLFQRAIQ